MHEFIPRKINYLRLSITDRCNLRCVYCTYWQDWQKLPSEEILTYEELLRLAWVAAGVGVCKIRITGGEPLVRRGIVGFLQDLNRIPGIDKVCLTTNGVLLAELAPNLYNAGLRHLNISLDTLRRDRYREITGKDNWREVMAGLELALAQKFHPIKINCVVLKGLNDDEIMDLALLARDYPIQVRFIELMPTVSQELWGRHFLPITAMHQRLAGLGRLSPVIPAATNGPARIFRVMGFQGELGFISPMSNHHCESCNRLRLTAAGQLRPCLLMAMELDLKASLRQSLSDRSLACLIQEAMQLKDQGSGVPFPQGSFPTMANVGG